MDTLLPNFLVVGTAKAGTTSLYNYLIQHSDIFIPDRKECRFFSGMNGDFKGIGCDFQNDVIKDINEYKDLFKEGASKRVKGDISNDYLYYYKNSIDNIKKYLPSDVKIIIILRNPVDRAYSNYLHHVRALWEKLTFEESLIAEEYRMMNNWAWPWFYKKTGFYYEPVKAFLENFNYVKIFLYEDLKKDSQLFVNDICDFLNVDNISIDTGEKYNKRGIPKNKLLHKLIRKENKIGKYIEPIIKKSLNKETRTKIKEGLSNLNMNRSIKSINEYTKIYLQNEYRSDILQLQKIINRDLSKWLI